jgi:hypothetical protein
VRRLRELEARRRLLIARCELQRAELAERVGELKDSPLSRAATELLGRPRGAPAMLLVRPLTWAAALAGLLLLRRPRQVLTLLGWARVAVSFGSRAALILRVLDQLRSRSRERNTAKP